MQNLELMKTSAVNFGFDPSWIADILTKYGPDVVTLALEAARNGLSVGLIVEVIQRFGPQILELFITLLSAQNSQQRQLTDVIPGPVITGDLIPTNTALIEVLLQKYLPIIMQQYLPLILNKYGPQIMQAVVTAVMQYLQSLQKQPK